MIAHIYTEQYGMQSFLLNGVRKAQPRFNSNLLQPLTCVEIVAYIKSSKSLHRVSEITASPVLTSVPFDTVKTTIALFLAEVIYRSIREEEKNPALFEFIYNSVIFLDKCSGHYNLFHLLFLTRLCRYLGFYPQNVLQKNACIFDLREGVFTASLPDHPDVLDEGTSRCLSQLLQQGIESMPRFSLSSTERKNLLRSLVTYYELHQTHGFRLQSLDVLEEVMS